MKIYLATSWKRQAEMREYRTVLSTLGHEVTSSWIDVVADGLDAATLGANPAKGIPEAKLDLEDIARSDALMKFTGVPSGTGGMHVELGFALGLGKRVILVGPHENIFHTLPSIEWYPDWDALMAEWRVGA